jgi:hypothetical protein
MEKPWFRRSGILYFPNATMGWVFLILLLMYWTYSFIGVDIHSHSVIDMLINFAFNALFGLFVYQIIGYLSVRSFKKSHPTK